MEIKDLEIKIAELQKTLSQKRYALNEAYKNPKDNASQIMPINSEIKQIGNLLIDLRNKLRELKFSYTVIYEEVDLDIDLFSVTEANLKTKKIWHNQLYNIDFHHNNWDLSKPEIVDFILEILRTLNNDDKQIIIWSIKNN